MTRITGVLARVEVDSIEAALPLYQRLSGASAVRRFAFGALDLAWVGSFLLLSGPPDALRAARRTATLLVDDLSAALAEVVGAGGTVLDGPAEGPNGPRMIARHPDGAVFEYIQPAGDAPRA